MNIDDSAERGIAPSTPLFASSWMALYLLLKEELESFLEDAAQRDDTQENRTERPN